MFLLNIRWTWSSQGRKLLYRASTSVQGTDSALYKYLMMNEITIDVSLDSMHSALSSLYTQTLGSIPTDSCISAHWTLTSWGVFSPSVLFSTEHLLKLPSKYKVVIIQTISYLTTLLFKLPIYPTQLAYCYL